MNFRKLLEGRAANQAEIEEAERAAHDASSASISDQVQVDQADLKIETDLDRAEQAWARLPREVRRRRLKY